MDRNSTIGFVLLIVLFTAYVIYNRNAAPEDLGAPAQDSLAQAPAPDTSASSTPLSLPDTLAGDSVADMRLALAYGAFAPAAKGAAQAHVLENEHMAVHFSSKGGHITKVLLKQHFKTEMDKDHEEEKIPLTLLEDDKNRFEYIFPVKDAASRQVSSADLYFQATASDTAIVFRAPAGEGRYFEQRYRITDDYEIKYDIAFVGLGELLDAGQESITLNWVNYLDRLERNTAYERNYSTVYFKALDEGSDHCSCTGDDTEAPDEPIKWVSHVNQFFNTSIIADESFQRISSSTELTDDASPDLKKLSTQFAINYNRGANESFGMTIYSGPNEFERLAAYKLGLADIIPFGSSIFGTVNRWIIRPIFSFLSSFIGSAGVVIILLTFVVKMALYPLQYRILRSSAKMKLLKPEMDAMRKRAGGDQQQMSAEMMKIYQESGVSPLSGCMPMLLQMPIWFALYRFFPASIEFRQQSFLWASDLSSYDVIAWLPLNVPFYGEHISLFTLLWAAATVAYTYYNMQTMEMQSAGTNPEQMKMMKYLQYFMPVTFLFFFNSVAAGLTCYMLFSQVLNVAQTVITKNYVINEGKLQAELDERKKSPKKKSAFQERLQQAMKEQQRIQAERDKQRNKGK